MSTPLDWPRDGAAHHPAAAAGLLPALHQLAADLPQERAGLRLHGHPALPALLATGPIHNIAAQHLGPAAQPVRAVLFDKTPATNWSLGWHQDRTIAVRARADVPGYGPWSIKQGIQHVEPPFAITAAMVTLRLHLDDTPADNAPLLIAPARTASAASRKTRSPTRSRAAARAPASPALGMCGAMPRRSSTRPRRRRAIAADACCRSIMPRPLPAPLVWLGL